MGKTCKVQVNGAEFSANYGDLLLDAALMNGVDIPFDCRSGYCGTCNVHVVKGRVFGGETGDAETVRACQCRVVSDLEVAVEDVPEVVIQQGQVTRLVPLAPDVMEVVIALPEPAHHLPGQYYKLQFRGFPTRCFSATPPLTGRHNDRLIHFHIRLVPDGRVSSQLGRAIRVGHRVKMNGPLGSAYLRPALRNRLVLVAGGTGFAPIWSIADAAMREWSERELVVVVGARELESLYMIPALCRLARCPKVSIIPVVQESQAVSPAVRSGFPTDHVPALTAHDIVYTCGAPPMVEKVEKMASAAGAKCYCDPFESASEDDEESGLLTRAVRWFTSAPEMSPLAAPGRPGAPGPQRAPALQSAPPPQRAPGPKLAPGAQWPAGPQRPPAAQRAQGPQPAAGPQRTPGPQRAAAPGLQRSAEGPQPAAGPQRGPQRAAAPGLQRGALAPPHAPGAKRAPAPQAPAQQRAQGPRRDVKETARGADLARYAPPRARNKPAWLREPQISQN